MSDTELEEREQNAGQHDKIDGGLEGKEIAALDQKAGLKEDKNDEIPYTDEGKRPKGFRAFVTKRKTAGGLIIGLLLGGSLGLATITSGPLQFIHISQLLQRFHFVSIEDNGNGRLLKLYKYAKNKKAGQAENSRLGVLGNKIAENIDARYEKIGMEKQFSDTLTARYEGLSIDPAKFAENAKNGEQFKDLTTEEFKAKFKEAYGVNLTEEGGKLFAPADSGIFAYFRNKNLNLIMADESGLNKISGAVATRVMGKRDAITWHPIKAADAYIVGTADQKFSAWLKEQKDRMRGSGDESLSAEPLKDDKGNSDPASQDGANATNDTIKTSKESLDQTGNPEAGYLSKFTESTAGGAILKGTAVIGLACALNEISNSAAALKHDMVVLPMIRMGMEAISLGNQVMSGKDLSVEQLGFFSKQLYSQDKGSWASGKSIQAELGQDQTGRDIPDEANLSKIKSGGMFSAIIGGIPGIDTICKASSSTIGKAFSVAISLTTPIATIAQTAITSTPAFKDALGGIIKWLAGGPVPTMVFGSDYGNMINYGSRLASNDAAASMGGISLSDSQTAELRNYENNALKQEIGQRSFAERMFDVYSPDSLASKAIDSTSGSATANVASIMSSITNPLKAFAIFKAPFASKVSAASPPYDYGFAKVGFSLEDMNSDTYENPYDNATAVTAILSGSKGQDYISKAQKCFGVTLGADGSLTSDMKAKIDTTSDDYKNLGCDDPATDWARIRFYVLDMKTAQASDCYDNTNTESCQQSGFGQASASAGSTGPIDLSTVFQPSDTIACAPGTNDVGIQTGYHDGTAVPIRVCALPNLSSTGQESSSIPGANGNALVNSRASGAFFALVNAAKTAGIAMGANSSFRTMANQQALFAANPDPARVARPGYSNHQMGLAIDFTCNGSTVTSGDACFAWLSQNAGQFGIKNYPAEAWHWSVTGN